MKKMDEVLVCDNTEKKLQEQKLIESEEKYRRLFETMSTGVIYHDMDGSIISANPAAERMIGITLDQMQGKTTMDPRWKMIREDGSFVPGPEHPSMIALRTGEKNGPVTRGIFIPERNEYVWLSVTSTPLFREGEDKPFQVYAVFDDVTQRKRAEEEAQAQRNLLESMLHSIQDGVCILDADLTIREVNHTMEKLYHHAAPLKGKKCFEAYHDRTEPCSVCPSIQAIQQKNMFSEIAPIMKDGRQEGWVEVFAYPLINRSNGSVEGAVEFVRDITQRVRQEEELRLQNGLITSLLNSIPDLVFYKDLEGVFLGCNQAFAESIGFAKEEIPGKTDYDLNDKEAADFYRENDKKMMEQLAARQNEEWVTYPDGRKVLLDTMKTPYWDHEGNLIGLLAISRDITDRKKDEEKLQEFAGLLEQKNRELENAVRQSQTANEAKSRYLAHMNHEIRTPLNGFMGFLQLMEGTRLDEEQQNFMDHMKLSTNHMLSIINNVLDMAVIEAGEMQLTNRIFTLEEEIDTALAPLRSLARQNNIHLEMTMDKNLPNQVEGDPNRLRQIVLNLGGNAVKFTQEGQVRIAIRCLETTEEHHTLELVVEDTGPGMKRETLDKLFMPFYQADDGIAPQSKGTGLGMTITRELVELMGGQIKVDSTPGKGTRMEVLLILNRVTDL